MRVPFRFFIIFFSNNKLYLLKLFVEEAISSKSIGESVFRAYELKDIKKVAENIGSLTRKNKAYGAESTNDVSTTAYSVADLYDFVKISIVYAADTRHRIFRR